MDEERAKRKLSGIPSADAVGYSRLMRQNEAATVATVKEYRKVLGSLIQKYSGRVVDSPGDNILAEFGSVVNAVECVVQMQNELKNRNQALPHDRKMDFRIGIHIGDVLEEEKLIYGEEQTSLQESKGSPNQEAFTFQEQATTVLRTNYLSVMNYGINFARCR